MVLRNVSSRAVVLFDVSETAYNIAAYSDLTVNDALWTDNTFRRWLRLRVRDIVVNPTNVSIAILPSDFSKKGTLAGRPAAGSAGVLYYVTDSGSERLTRDNGATWDDVVPNYSKLIGVPTTFTPILHATTHQAGAADAITGNLDANARVNLSIGGASQGTRRSLNIINGGGLTITAADNSGSERVDVTITANDNFGAPSGSIITTTYGVKTTYASGGFFAEALTASSTPGLQLAVTGDTNDRLAIQAGGTIQWGPGSGVADTNLYRNGVGVLKTDTALVVGTSLTAGATGVSSLTNSGNITQSASSVLTFLAQALSTTLAIRGAVTADTNDRWNIDASGKHQWGSGSGVVDTNLYRSTTGTLKTDGTLLADTINVTTALQQGGTAVVLTTDSRLSDTRTPTDASVTNAKVNASAAIAYSKLALTASIVNADISATAAIAYSKLALTGSVVNADISTSAAIAYSKLALTGSVVNADISTSAAIAYSKLSLAGSIATTDLNFTPIKSGDAAGGDLNGTFPNPGLAVLVRADANTEALGVKITGDTAARFDITGDGTHRWGAASGTFDATFYRASSGVLRTNATLTVDNGITSNKGVTITAADSSGKVDVTQAATLAGYRIFNSTTPTTPTFTIIGSGKLQWAAAGGSLDTNLYRSAAGVLATDFNLSLAGTTSMIQARSAAASSTVVFGTRISTDTVDRLTIAADGTLNWTRGGSSITRSISLDPALEALNFTNVNLYSTGNVTAAIGTANQVVIGSSGDSNAYIKFGSGADANIYRVAANSLKTDGYFDAIKGIATLTKAGSVSDSDFSGITIVDGTLAVDTTNNQVWFRSGGAWKNTTSLPLVSKSAAYTATTADCVIVADATSAAFSVTLPTAVGATGKVYTVKRINTGANAVTIATTSSQTIDGATTRVISNAYDSVTVISDGSNWQVI